MKDNTILIDRYLQNDMSAEERNDFEKRLQQDNALRDEMTSQQQMIDASENAGIKAAFSKAITKHMLVRRWIKIGIAAVIVVALAFLHHALKHDSPEGEQNTKVISGLPIPERITISNAKDTIIETPDGLVLAIPAHAFNTSVDLVQLEIKTALTINDIVKYGLSTMSDSNLLSTAGMFSINGFDNGKQLSLDKEITVNIPAKEINPSMQLFDGVEDKNGIINWKNPKPIEKRLRTYDVKQLDFYPQAYIPLLKAMNLSYQDKRYTDSLYYSFSSYNPFGEAPGQTTSIENTFSSRDTLSDSTKTNEKHDPESEHYIHYEIDPSRIRALWDSNYNNTIIATKEFEERLHYIQTICRPEFLTAYITSLNKPMWEIDQFIASVTTADIRKKIKEFAARKDGGIIVNSQLQKKLSNYFYQKSNAYREAVEKTYLAHAKEIAALNKAATNRRDAATVNELERMEKVFNEELCINLKDAYNQVGVKRDCPDTVIAPPPTQYYNVTVTTTGWKNLDVYVFDATKNRESMDYTDPMTGKKATLTYSEIEVRINARDRYDRVLVYLLPDSLSSFQRIAESNGVAKDRLNVLLKYDLLVIAYKDTTAYYHQQKSIKPGVITIDLNVTSQTDLENFLKAMTPSKSAELYNEFDYQLFEQKESIRQVKEQKDLAFRQKVAAVIFVCGIGEGASDSTITNPKPSK